MPFVHPYTVRFGQVDAAGIAYFSRAFEICHEVLEEMLAAGGLPLGQILRERDWAMPLVHAEADYKRPLRLGDRLTVEMSLEQVGLASVTYRYRLLGEAGELRAQVRLVHSCIDQRSFRTRAWPEELGPVWARAGLEYPASTQE